MRRKMSALTTTIFGAVVTASTVSAQQLPSADQTPRGKSAAPESAAASDPDPLFGMTAMRGARYLLRNGLDYLNYQQYDRALKFLREAENRQKELSKAEKLSLKQGIERAQRGLRDAADAEAPYALSDRSNHRNGFTAAKPDIKVASNSDQGNPSSRKPTRPDQPPRLGNDSEDQGEPIRLAAADLVSSEPTPPQSDVTPGSINTKNAVADGRPSRMPAIPTLPATPQLTDPAGSDAYLWPSQGATSPNPGPSVAGLVRSRRPVTPTAETQDQNVALVRASEPPQRTGGSTPNPGDPLASLPSLDPATDSTAPSTPPSAGKIALDDVAAVKTNQTPAPAAAANTAIQTDSEASNALAADKQPQPPTLKSVASPLEKESAAPSPAPVEPAAPSPALVESAASAPAPVEPTAPSPVSAKATTPAPVAVPASSGLAQAVQPAATPTPAEVIDLERVPLPPLANGNGQPENAGDTAHKETEVTVTSSRVPEPEKAATPTQTADATPQPLTINETNDLPPLPAVLGQTEMSNPANAAAPTQSASSTTVPPAPAAPADLPTLPGEQGAPHSENEHPNALGGMNEPRPAAPVITDGSRDDHATTVLPLLQPAATTAVSSGRAPEPDPGAATTELNLPAIPDATSPAGASPTVAAPPAQAPATAPYPTSNPNLVTELPPVGVETGVQETTSPISTKPGSGGRMFAGSGMDPFFPERPTPPSTLRPELQREVEEIARRQEDELRRQTQNPPQPSAPARDTSASDLRAQTQLDISRAPSPAEARPIKAIPVPEDWVPLAERDWSPQRKYWAAAATCHLPLYFQDPVLERYGHSVEQFVGPIGRYLSYPVDDPAQSTQRNQLVQPFFSIGLFSLQILAWPYNLIMDPPWEAQYDLGYYRPGDNIPTDTYWLPLHGYGPPLRGSRY